jgi:hypothetical protein
MIWTTEKPTVSGWYWWHDSKRTITLVCHVEFGVRDGCVSFAYGERYRLMSTMNGEWAGPLAPPE